MRRKIVVAPFALAAVLAVGTAPTSPVQADTAAKSAIINLAAEPVRIAGSFVYGPVIFEHDDARMARGEPCTAIYRFVRGVGKGEELVSFHCQPRWGKAPGTFVLTTERNANGNCVLREYQFAGDAEAHGVPATGQ